VTIPANSTATLLLPSQKVKEGDQPIVKHPHIKILGTGNNSLKLLLTAGNYHFTF
jgi:hypothetical protein